MTDSPVMTTTKPAEPSASKNTKKNPLSDGQGALAAALISPTMAVILFVVGIPILMSLRESVFRKNEGIDPNTGMVAQGESFVGLQNFTDIFANPTLVQGNWGNIDRLLNSFANTTFFTIVCVVLETILGVAMALIMAKAFKGQGLVRAAILVPWAIPTIVSAKMWGSHLRLRRGDEQDRRSADSLAGGRPSVTMGDHHRRCLEDRTLHRSTHPGRPADHSGRGV